MRGHLAKLDLLILDELRYVPASKAGAELLFDVIATAYELGQRNRHDELAFRELVQSLGQRAIARSRP